MSKHLFRAALGACLLIFAGACGDDSSGPTGPTPGETFPASMVQTFGETAGLLGDYAANAFDFNGTNVGFAPAFASAGGVRSPEAVLMRVQSLLALQGGPALSAPFLSSASCTPTVSGSGTDTDGDGIPNDMLVEYTADNCTVTDTATGDVQVTRGTLRYRDTSNDLYGFDLTVTALRQDSYNGTSREWSSQVVDTHETARTTASGGTWALFIDASLNYGTADTVDLRQDVTYDVHGTYTSNGAVPAGGPIPDGTISLSGSLDATLPTVGRLVVTLVTTDPLHFESSCTAVDNGKVELRLNGQSDEGVLTKWIGCDDYSFEFLGSGVL